jgi:hypothetical protein
MNIVEEIRGFQWGVQAAAEHDETPLESSPFAHNTALRSIGGGLATFGTRPGLKIVNETALTSAPSFHLIKNYPYNASGITNNLAIITSIGRLYYKDADNVIGAEIVPPANFPFTSGHCFASGDFAVDAAVLNNRLFLVNTNGERRSLLDDDFKTFGLDHIATIATSNQGSGSSSMPAETYDVVTTTYDSATGAESSASPIATVTLAASERIRVIITPTAGESARYSHWRIYIRRQTTQTKQFRALVIEDAAGANITSTGDIPIATTTAYVDLTAAQIAALILVAPSETENNEPLTSARYIASYGGRLILADLQNFYWSKLNFPDAFPTNNSDRLDTGEGDEIRGLHEFSDDLLLIFTANNVWGIFGNDPQTWTIKAVDHSVGCASHRSIVQMPGGVMWWSDTQGPVFFDGTSVQKYGLTKLGPDIVVTDVEGARMPYINAGWDAQGQRALLSYTLLNGLRNTAILPFNAEMEQFDATRWNPMDISCMGTGYDSDEKLKLFMGNYGGQIFILDSETLNDGAPDGTLSGTFTPASSSIGTIASTEFYTTGAGLAERYVVVKNSTDRIVGRERIASNTDTTLTLAANITGLTAGELHSFDVGGADFRLYTKQLDFKQAFFRKRVDNVYLHVRTNSSDLQMSTLINASPTIGTLYPVTSLAGDVFDSETAIFDTTTWGGQDAAKKRIRVIRNCNAIQIALFHTTPNVDVMVLKISALGRALSDRYYG